MGILFDQETKHFHLFNERISYVIRLVAERYPLHVYWGKRVRRVTENLLEEMTPYNEENFSLNELSLDCLPHECPTFGTSDLREGMLHIRHADGTHSLDLRYESYRVMEGKPELEGLPSARGEKAHTLILILKDAYSGLRVELAYTVYEDVDILARSMRVINDGKNGVVIEKALSACVDFEDAEYSLLTLSGAWAREREMHTRPLVMGEQGVSSVRGASGHQTSPFMALLAPNTYENQGEVYGFSLCYSGNFMARVIVDQYNKPRAQIGIHPFNFSWNLAPGETFQTPEAYLCYSPDGLNGMSHQFHRFTHAHITTGSYAVSRRPLLINNWEATYFDFNEEKLLKLAREAKAVGIELFVLDDGWFGRRNQDNCSLGDWYDNEPKLPHGLEGLAEQIHDLGLKFGIWVEPEMISPDSDLYRAHPDWCIHAGGRERTEKRNQLTLDMARADVRTYLIDTISNVITRGHVDYVKWDMNRNITQWGSEALAPEQQKEQAHRYILGLYEVMGTITRKFPNVLFESCAGGGGRFDFGILCFMPQGWCSDDTDAWMRCRIQYSTSLVFPPSEMGAHVSAVPNHQMGRVSPLTTRAHVAMGGTYGYELDLGQLSKEELDEIAKLNEQVKNSNQRCSMVISTACALLMRERMRRS